MYTAHYLINNIYYPERHNFKICVFHVKKWQVLQTIVMFVNKRFLLSIFLEQIRTRLRQCKSGKEGCFTLICFVEFVVPHVLDIETIHEVSRLKVR